MENKKIIRVILLIAIIIISLIVTYYMVERYPSLSVIVTDRYSLWNNDTEIINQSEGNTNIKEFGKSTHHYYCDENFKNSVILVWKYTLDPRYVNEGDVINIESKFISNLGNEYYSGYNLEKLKKVKKGNNIFDTIYYRGGNITIYSVGCFNVDFDKTGESVHGFDIRTPSFIDSKLGYLLIFLTSFILLGETYKLISYFLFNT